MTDTPGWTPPTEGSGEQPPEAPPAQWGSPPPPPPPPPGYGPPPGWGQQPPPGQWGGQPGQWAGEPGQWGGQPGQWGGQPPPGQWGGQPGWNPQWGQPGYGAWGRTAPKPGIIPLRPLGLGEILDGGFAIIRRYPKVTLGLSAIVISITQAISFLLSLGSLNETGVGDPGSVNAFDFAQVVTILLGGIATVVLAGMLTSVMGEAVLGRETTIGATWAKVRPRFWALLGGGILGGLVPVIALVACIAPGVFLWGAWAFITPVIILERAGVGAAISRSWRLAVPDWWRVWGIRALATLVAGVINSVLTVPFSAAGIGSALFSGDTNIGVLPLALITLGSIVGQTITTPFSSGVLALLYIDRRMRAEGLDVTLQQVAQQETA